LGLYAWLAASILTTGSRRWLLACIGFLVSVHNYPAAAWHTIDGILFSVLGWWLLLGSLSEQGRTVWTAPPAGRLILASIAIFGATMCKQSFYPQPLVFLTALMLMRDRKAWWYAAATLAICYSLFFGYLQLHGILPDYFRYTAGATTSGLALEHGLLDYFKIKPILVFITAILLVPAILLVRSKHSAWSFYLWCGWLAALAGSYAWAVHTNQDYTAPFAQSRLLVVLSFLFGAWAFGTNLRSRAELYRFGCLLILSWCAAISWGFNLPILFLLPSLYLLLEITDWLTNAAAPALAKQYAPVGAVFSIVVLLGVFRYAYSFVYRDGPRSQMTESMGQIFPSLSGIYSDKETAELYLDLKKLVAKYGANFKTLPSFSQASFLCHSYPPLQLDWVVKRENNGLDQVLYQQLVLKKPVLLIEKHYGQQLETDPEMLFARTCLYKGKILEETPHFWVVASQTE
jgi:hypothetical protein